MESGGTPLRRPRTSPHVSLNSKHRPQILPTRAFAHLLDHPLLQLHLRPLLTSISPLMTAIRDATGLSFYGASLLTSLPVVAMGAMRPFGASGVRCPACPSPVQRDRRGRVTSFADDSQRSPAKNPNRSPPFARMRSHTSPSPVARRLACPLLY
ncbi:hypothetical protein OKW40_005259 [Paraburkholderia sp. RAU6.4a]|uniref:hypothetical protein n=1 Tax=Paraburkholderia sp. RAU6.4a TaxID=2991067 RepID=UPI003D1CD78B